MTNEVAVLVAASDHLPAIASYRLLSGDSGQLFGRPVSRQDREVRVEREETSWGLAGFWPVLSRDLGTGASASNPRRRERQ
jgi:hypothetical protein